MSETITASSPFNAGQPAPDTAPPAALNPDGGTAALLSSQTGQQDGEAPAIPSSVIDAFGDSVRPIDYHFPQVEGENALPLPQQIELRNALCSEGIPKSTGSALAILWNQETSKPATSPAMLEALGRSAVMELERKHGADRAAAILKDARAEAGRLARRSPLIRQALENTGLGNSALLAEMLHTVAQGRRHNM